MTGTTPTLFGILNITDDSFSDGGKYLEPEAAIAHGRALANGGAAVIDIGAASSNPMSKGVPPEVEIGRLTPVVPALQDSGIALSIDTFAPETQRWALAHGVGYINDIQGFPFPEMYPELAASQAKLIVMHSVQGLGPATRVSIPPDDIFDRVATFFDARLPALERAGIARERIILDPGMGLFLGTEREASFTILRRLPELKAAFGLPVLISVSRKSVIRTLVDRTAQDSAPVTLAAELFSAMNGADYIRTHNPRALRDALKLWNRLSNKA